MSATPKLTNCLLPEADHHTAFTTTHEDEAGTIGSRLRKRRRTGSSPVEITPSKRLNTRQTLSPERKRNNHVETNLRELAPSIKTPPATLAPPIIAMNGKPKSSPEVEREETMVVAESPVPPPTPAPASSAPDLAAVIANIIDHGENVDNHWAAQGYEYDEMAVDTDSWLSVDASLHLKIQSLPILDNLVRSHAKTGPHSLIFMF